LSRLLPSAQSSHFEGKFAHVHHHQPLQAIVGIERNDSSFYSIQLYNVEISNPFFDALLLFRETVRRESVHRSIRSHSSAFRVIGCVITSHMDEGAREPSPNLDHEPSSWYSEYDEESNMDSPAHCLLSIAVRLPLLISIVPSPACLATRNKSIGMWSM
jgi:hypothetical protein